MFDKLEDVTYQAFGIDPCLFYKDRFNKVVHHNYFDIPANYYLLGSGRIRFLCEALSGGRVLDLGCGGGPFGMTLKKNKKADYLVGIDLDEECLRVAAEQYDEVVKLNMMTSLPFPDHSFDAVFSSDFFGHVEFRYKDALIEEIHRILKPGGKTVHLAESAVCDYLHCNQDDPNDPIRQYVYIDGHIGIETPSALKQRFSKFTNVHVRESSLFPFFTVQGFINNANVFGEKFAEFLKQFSPAEAQAADIVTGYINDYLIHAMTAESADILDPTRENRILPQVLQKGCGLVFLTAEKKTDTANA